MDSFQTVTIIGEQESGGLYLLRILVKKDVSVRFGRYQNGDLVMVPTGEYVYVGSAKGQRGPSTLANRIIRHATRSGNNKPHRIRRMLIEQFQSRGSKGEFPSAKTLHWHIDYLLDMPETEIRNVIVFYGKRFSEMRLAKVIQDHPDTDPLAPGLGASDDPGRTHLLAFRGGDVWWRKLITALQTKGV